MSKRSSKQGRQEGRRSSSPARPAAQAAVQERQHSVKRARQERRVEEQRRREEERRRARRNRVLGIGAAVVAVLLLVGLGVYFLAPRGNPAYPSIDNISCDASEQVAVHYHAHITVYINGQNVQIPQGVGIAQDQSCLYWLHTHDSSGVVHIEAPQDGKYTLGNFLHIWEKQFPSLGTGGFPPEFNQQGWTIYVNGKPYNGDLHNIQFQSHQLITLAYNSPNVKPDTTYNWSGL